MTDTLHYEVEYACGDRNTTDEIKATPEGLDVDGRYVLPWEWIDQARQKIDDDFGIPLREKGTFMEACKAIRAVVGDAYDLPTNPTSASA